MTTPNVKQIDNDITIVTGIWDIKRSDLSEGWSRSYDHYVTKFKELLNIPNNMIIFGEKDLEEIVFEHPNRTRDNTQFIQREQEWFKNHFFNEIQSIRNNENWKNHLRGYLILHKVN